MGPEFELTHNRNSGCRGERNSDIAIKLRLQNTCQLLRGFGCLLLFVISLHTHCYLTLDHLDPQMEKETTLEWLPDAPRQPSTDGEKLHVQISTLNALSPEQTELQENDQYINGLRLFIVMLSFTMVFFLVMLDVSIIATVSQASSRLHCLFKPDLPFLAGHPSHHKRLPFSA